MSQSDCFSLIVGFSRKSARIVAGLFLLLPGLSVRAEDQRAPLPMLRQSLPAGGSVAGDLPSSQPVPSLTVELKRTAAQQADLEDYLKSVRTAGSPDYHHWLTPEQFAARFAPAPADLEPVKAWLASQGLAVQTVSAGGMRLSVSGTASQVATAFAIHLQRYAMPSGDAVSIYGTPTVPKALAASVLAVGGLDTTASSAADGMATLEDAVDANTAPVVVADLATSTATAEELNAVLEQAGAQGQTVIALHTATASLPVHALVLVSPDTPVADTSDNATPRPDWQIALGLPADTLRAAPDATVVDANALAAALQQIVTKAGSRQGEAASTFYKLAPVKGVFTHADSSVAAGTWSAADGLGTVNVDALVKAWPYGVTPPQSSTIALSTHVVTHGSNLTLTATITAGSGMPTGSVTFGSAQGGTLGVSALDASGVATFTTKTLAGGQYGFYGNYGGDNTYAASTTNVDTATVSPEAASIAGGVPSAAAVGATIPVTVTVAAPSGVGTPAGAVTVYPYGTAIASNTYTGTLAAGTTAGTSTATVNVPASNAGSFTFQTNCTTDASFSCYQPASFAVTVGKGTPVVALTQTGSETAAVLTAAVTAPTGSSSSAAVPTGRVQFLDGTTALGSGTLNSSGVATYSGALSNGATHTVTATYGGDGNYVTASSNTTTSTKTTPAVVLTSVNSGAALQAVVQPPSGSTSTPTGTVQFLDGTTALGTGTLNASGVALYMGAFTTGATHSITAVYAGDTNYNTAISNVLGQTSTLIATTTALTSSSGYSGPYGTLFSLISAVTPASFVAAGTAPSGTIILRDSLLGVVGTGTLVSGTATTTVSTLPVGTHTLTATYSGDGNYAASSTVTPVVFTVSRLSATVTATISPTGSILYGNDATLDITVTAISGTVGPTGAVTATVSGNNGIYTATLAATTGSLVSSASVSLPVPPPGSYTITIGCNTNITCNAATVRLTTTKGSTTTIITTLTPTTPQAGTPVTVSAAVASSGMGTGMYTYSGTVSFYSNNRFLGSAPVSNGIATRTVTFLSTAAQAVTAIYAGDVNWTGSTSTALSVTPTPLPATIVVSASALSGVVGQNITLSAALSSGERTSTLIPTGTVTFYDTYNDVVANLGTVTLLSNGLNTSYAQLSTTGLRAGAHTIMVVYAGDLVFERTTSLTIIVNVGDFTLTFLPSALNVTVGNSVKGTLAIASLNGLSGSIAVSCSVPADTLTTCAIAPQTLATGSTAQFTVTTTKNTASASLVRAAGSTAPRVMFAAVFGGALSLCFVRRRRRIAAVLLILLVAMIASGGCTQVSSSETETIGGGSGGTANNGTPLGTLNLTITAASVDSPTARHTYLIPVTVQ